MNKNDYINRTLDIEELERRFSTNHANWMVMYRKLKVKITGSKHQFGKDALDDSMLIWESPDAGFQQYENSVGGDYSKSPQKRRNASSNQLNSIEQDTVASKMKKLPLNEIGKLKRRRQNMESKEERGGGSDDIKSQNQLPNNSDLIFDNQTYNSIGDDKTIHASVSQAVIVNKRRLGKNSYISGISTPL